MTAPGQYGRIRPWGTLLTTSTNALTGFVHLDGSGGAPQGGWLRIAELQASSWIGGPGNTTGVAGVPISQISNIGRLPIDPPFNPALSVHVFRFGLRLDATNTSSRTLIVDAPLDGFGNLNTSTGEREVWWLTSLNEANGSIRGTPALTPAAIHVPAPGLGVFCIAPLIPLRRRWPIHAASSPDAAP